jgi:hypothetical protein
LCIHTLIDPNIGTAAATVIEGGMMTTAIEDAGAKVHAAVTSAVPSHPSVTARAATVKAKVAVYQ